ncbi:hypothetical protein RJ639_011471 [Escallonia herrerae]|uniref:Fe2OG dioxygenase domain-containing protein n=1 Tax=Escallonia herrerae TaxID=1293975 RepID=A0AA89ATF8_9ASTE|nr:hypothetical protein RJ639_011471 [Escallonia herrerae]
MVSFMPPLTYGVVQELAQEPISNIPQQYVQENQEPAMPTDGDGASSLPTMPVVDLNRLIERETKDSELERLHTVCKEWGMFQLVNHGVSISLVEKLKSEIKNFYESPLEERTRYKIRPGDFEGYGQTILHSADQKVDWADRFYMMTNPIHRRKPHLMPELPSSFRSSLSLSLSLSLSTRSNTHSHTLTLESYFSELQKLSMTLFGLMAEALKMDKIEIEGMFEDGLQSVRMNYYPPCPQPEQVIGLTPHSDATGITILLQVNGVEGLQVKKDGVWLPVKFLPDAFVVNLGDIMEILSNGLYNSIEHRATVNSTTERISIAMFFNPKIEAEVGPALSLTNSKNPPLFKRVLQEEYLKDFFSRKLNGKFFLEHMKIKTGQGQPN